MFSKISRYRKLLNIVATDSKGRSLESKTLRLLPEVTGEFLHTVEEVERLDHMAYKYYKQPKKWWRICDANPEFMSPQALLGKEPIVTAIFPIEWAGPVPLWSKILDSLSTEVGIESAVMGAQLRSLPDEQIFDGTIIFDIAVSIETDLHTGITTQELSTDLGDALQVNGITFLTGVRFSYVADNIWRITDQSNKNIYTFKLEDGLLNVYESITHYVWVVKVTYNEMNTNAGTIADRIYTLGFSVGLPERIGRVGKKIIIPRNTVG
jgi:hypothetical protein